jgi:hypothetical protein
MARLKPGLLITLNMVAIVSVYAYYARGEKAPSAQSNNVASIIAGKTVVVEIAHLNKDDEPATLMFTNAEVLKLGERSFMVGDNWAPKGDESWYADVINAVPCDNILRIQAMTPEQFKKYSKTFVDMPKK